MKKYTISFACISVCVYLLTVMDQRKCTKKLCKKQQSLSCLKHPCVDRNYIIFLILIILFTLSTLLKGFFLLYIDFVRKITVLKTPIIFFLVSHFSKNYLDVVVIDDKSIIYIVIIKFLLIYSRFLIPRFSKDIKTTLIGLNH